MEMDKTLFLEKFNKVYDFLYTHDYVAGQDKAIAEFDKLLDSNNSFANFVMEFGRFRGDIICSDREAAAFMFTYILNS